VRRQCPLQSVNAAFILLSAEVFVSFLTNLCVLSLKFACGSVTGSCVATCYLLHATLKTNKY
jgi:hypothetical protein